MAALSQSVVPGFKYEGVSITDDPVKGWSSFIALSSGNSRLPVCQTEVYQ